MLGPLLEMKQEFVKSIEQTQCKGKNKQNYPSFWANSASKHKAIFSCPSSPVLSRCCPNSSWLALCSKELVTPTDGNAFCPVWELSFLHGPSVTISGTDFPYTVQMALSQPFLTTCLVSSFFIWIFSQIISVNIFCILLIVYSSLLWWSGIIGSFFQNELIKHGKYHTEANWILP